MFISYYSVFKVQCYSFEQQKKAVIQNQSLWLTLFTAVRSLSVSIGFCPLVCPWPCPHACRHLTSSWWGNSLNLSLKRYIWHKFHEHFSVLTFFVSCEIDLYLSLNLYLSYHIYIDMSTTKMKKIIILLSTFLNLISNMCWQILNHVLI